MASDVQQLIGEMTGALDAASPCLPAGVEASARAALDDAVRRYEQAGDHTVVALVGGTGSGKSSLFNSLTESEFADDGVLRPTTRRASASSWGNGATPLLDFLGVDRSRRLVRTSARGGSPIEDATGLVLLDLPDNDSVEEAHLQQVEQLLPVVDVLAWVVDPQKYADHLLHTNYLRVLRRRADAMVVIVNQIDTLTPAGLETIITDVKRLLVEDGLPDVEVLTTCALTGEGVGALWDRLIGVAASDSTAGRTIEAELAQVAARVLEFMGESEAAVDAAVIDEAVDELLAASGVPAVVDAIHSGKGVGRPQAPGRAAVAAIGSSWAARATEGLPDMWADAVEAKLPSVRQLQDSTTATLESVPVPDPKRGRTIGFWLVGGLLTLVAVILAVVAGIGFSDPASGGPENITLIVIAVALLTGAAAAFAQIPRALRTARKQAADSYSDGVRSAVRADVRDVLVLPTAEVLATHARARHLLEMTERR